jgi:hypothetical protein
MRAKQARRLLSALAIIPLCAAVAQGPPPDGTEEKPAPATVTFFATNNQGDPIRGLDQTDISILDSRGLPQTIVALKSAKDLPLRLGILIMNGLPWWEYGDEFHDHLAKTDAYEDAVKAALDFLPQVLSGPDDRAFIATYASISNGVRFLTRDQLSTLTPETILPARPPAQSFNPRPYPYRLTAASRWNDTEMTWTYDAIVLACAAMKQDAVQPARRILIVVGDAELVNSGNRHWPASGRMSKASYSDALAAAQQSGVTIFDVADGLSMDWLVRPTGGYRWDFLEPAHFPKPSYDIWSRFPQAFENIKTQVDNMYSVTYIPTGPFQPGRFLQLDLKITSNKDWKAHAPNGYFIPASVQ